MAGLMDVPLPDPNEAEAAPSDSLYVSDLPVGTTEDSLRGMFGPGVVQCRVLPSKTAGQGTVALVRFSSTKEALLVRETLNGAIPPGQTRPVAIRFCGAKPAAGAAAAATTATGGAPSYTKAVIAAAAHAARQSPYGAAGYGAKGGVAAQGQAGAEGPQPNDNLYVTGLPPGIDNASLLGLFSQYGQVVQCKVLPSPNEGMPPHALVRFSSVEEAAAVKKSLTGYALEGVNEPLVIEFAHQKPRNNEGWGGKGGSDAGKGGWDKDSSDGWGGKAGNNGSWGGGKGYDEGSKGGCEGGGGWGGSKNFDEGNKNGYEGGWGGSKNLDEGNKNGYEGSWGSSKGFDESGKGGYEGGGSWGGKSYEGEDGNAGEWAGGEAAAAEEDSSADQGSSKGAGKGDYSKGGKSGGKVVDRSQFTPEWGGMDRILQGFIEAQCLPGHKLGNEDNCLFVSGLPRDCDDIHLYRLLAPFGAITPTGVKAMKFPDGCCKGFGFVNFVEASACQAAAMMLHGTQLPDGSTINVVPKKSKKGTGKGAGKTIPAPNREPQQQEEGTDMLG